jgi:hypothetical protein
MSNPGCASQEVFEMGMIQAAVAEMHDRQRRAALKQRRELNRRRPLWAIDRLLDELEREHVRGRELRAVELAGLRERLPEIIGRSLPASVRSARTSTQLHAALLDWQEELYAELASRPTITGADPGGPEVPP